MNPKSEITDLTICRAFFAAWVFIYHVDLYVRFSDWLGPFSGLIRRGYLGVDGFFILSGMILAQVHPELTAKARVVSLSVGTQVKPLSFRDALIFWGKRLARIYPVHLAVLLIFGAAFMAGLALGLVPRDPARFSLNALWQNLALVQGWGFTSQGAWNYPSWSVSTEWAGYLSFPFLWFGLTYFERYVAPQVILVGFVVLGFIMNWHHGLNLTFAQGLIRFFPEFIIGMSTTRSILYVADSIALRRLAYAGGIGLTVFFTVAGVDMPAVFGIWLFLTACLMQADAHCPPWFRAPALRWLGQLSYAFYMSFALAELLTTQWFRHQGWAPPSHGLIFSAAMLCITFAVALVLHVCIEAPCRRGADRWLASLSAI